MAKEFFWPTCVTWKIPGDVAGVSGGIIYPTGVGFHTLMRRKIDKKYPHMARRLLDESSRVRSNHCSAAVWKGEDIMEMTYLASPVILSQRMGFRL